MRAMELMNSGAMFRYTPGVLSETALAEQAGETLSLVETGPQGTTFALSLPVVDAR